MKAETDREETAATEATRTDAALLSWRRGKTKETDAVAVAALLARLRHHLQLLLVVRSLFLS